MNDVNAATHLEAMLGEARRQHELAALNRDRYVLLARRYGMTNTEIGALVGISGAAVRKSIRRAQRAESAL